MYLTQKNNLVADKQTIDIIGKLCYHAARLYNVGLYEVRQYFFETGNYNNYNANYHCCKDNENYKLLLSDTSQQILRIVDRDFKSFFSLLFLKKQGKYSEKINIPHYKNKEGMGILSVQGRSARIRDGKVLIGITKAFREKYNIENKVLTFTLPKNLSNVETLQELRIIPKYNGKGFDMEFIYDSKYIITNKTELNPDNYLSIDPGVSNLATCFSLVNGNTFSYIIDGRKLKSINYYYNKKKAELQSVYDKQKININTKRFIRLSEGRKNRMNDYFNKSVKYITDYCITNKIATIVLGYNVDQKRSINIGRVNNQNMVMIPMANFRMKLESKCKLLGISFIKQEESYTSKASCYDLDKIPAYDKESKNELPFSGKRIKRGLYETSDKKLLNADLNGAINILRKYVTCKKDFDLSKDNVRAVVNQPINRINPINMPLLLGGGY
jgi:IS605 OrfB family transposase